MSQASTNLVDVAGNEHDQDPTTDDEPPRRRFKITVNLGADDYRHAAETLDRIATDMLIEQRIPRQVVSGGGWWITSEEDPAAPVGDEYDAALNEWFNRTHSRR